MKREENDWFCKTDNQSIKVLKKKGLRSGGFKSDFILLVWTSLTSFGCIREFFCIRHGCLCLYFFFLIDNKSFIEEKEQCVYDCKLIALEIYTLFLSIKGTMLMHLLLSIKFSYYL